MRGFLIAFLVLFGFPIADFFYMGYQARAVCDMAQPGVAVEEVFRSARWRGLSNTGLMHHKEQDRPDSALIHGFIGRHICRVEVADGRVVSSAYHFND